MKHDTVHALNHQRMKMSAVGTPPPRSELPSRKKIQRRHGACEPCRSSKTKCDGRMPCGACRSERRRQCPCKYSEKAMKLQQVTAEIRRRAESDKEAGGERTSTQPADEEMVQRQDDRGTILIPKSSLEDAAEPPGTHQLPLQRGFEQITEPTRMSYPISVCGAIEEFKILKPARGYSAHIVSRCQGFEAIEQVTTVEQSRKILQSASTDDVDVGPIQAVRTDSESLELQIMRSRLETVDRLIKIGHLERAWVDLPSLVRDMEYVLTHFLHGKRSSELVAWISLSQSAQNLEAQLALTIGRPTCLIAPRHSRETIDKETSILEESCLKATRADLYQRIQGLLVIDASSAAATRDFLEKADEILHHDPFVQVGLCTTAEDSDTARDLQLDTHLLFMIIHCRMAGLCDLFSRDLTNKSWTNTPAAEVIRGLSLHQPRQKLNCCRKMFRSARFVLDSFLSLRQDDTSLTGTTWIRCHGAYVAAVILGIGKLRYEVEWHATTEILESMERSFLQYHTTHPECRMFKLAVDRLRDLNSVKEPASDVVRNKRAGARPQKAVASDSVDTSPRNGNSMDVSMAEATKSPLSPHASFKRPIDLVDEPIADDYTTRERYPKGQGDEDTGDFQQHSEPSSAFTDLQLDHLSFFQDPSTAYSSQSASSFTTDTPVASSTTSFTENEVGMETMPEIPAGHPGPPFANPFPYDTLHPPMSWNNNMYAMGEPSAMSLSLRIPHTAQFQQTISPVTCPTVSTPRYSLRPNDDGLSMDSTNVSGHQTSPLAAAHRGTSQVELGSAFAQTAAAMPNLVPSDMAGVDELQTQLHSNEPFPTLMQTQTQDSGRPSVDRKNSANNMLQAQASGMGPSQTPGSVNWQLSHSATMGPVMVPRMLEGSSIMLGDARRASMQDVAPGEGLRQVRSTQGACYGGPASHQSPMVLIPQTFAPDHMAFFHPSTDMFEANQAQMQYTACQLPSSARSSNGQDGEQYQLQWRRVSIDAGGSGNTPY